MSLLDKIVKAKHRVLIVGTTPIAGELERAGKPFADMMLLNRDMTVSVLYESDSECFQQSLLLDTSFSINRISYDALITHRNRVGGPTVQRKDAPMPGLLQDVLQHANDEEERRSILARLLVRQNNLRMPMCIIIADDSVWYTVVTNTLPNIDLYQQVPKDQPLYEMLLSFCDFCADAEKGGIYLSRPGEELIQLYDRDGYPRGIFPRPCFYTTRYKRYSIWGFVFNRKGELLLQQRSMRTKDGRGLWDKSVGGHVDLRDYSTFRTAQRELVEELFLPEAEFSKYVQAYFKDIINFGDWNPVKRAEVSFKNAFAALDANDWILFRVTDEDGNALSVDRESQRRMHDDAGNVTWKPTVFISDVFFFIAPPRYLDDENQVKKTFELAEKKGAAQSHRLVTIGTLRDWIDQEKQKGSEREIFTDDLLFIDTQYRGLLERFSEFIRYIL